MFHCFRRVLFEAAVHCSGENSNRLSLRHWDEGKGSVLYRSQLTSKGSIIDCQAGAESFTYVLSFPPGNKPGREALLLPLPISKMRELKIRELKPLEVVRDEPVHLTATPGLHHGAPEKPSEKEKCGTSLRRQGQEGPASLKPGRRHCQEDAADKKTKLDFCSKEG